MTDIVENDFDNYKTKKLNKPRISCSYCSKSFASINVLNKHLVNEHQVEVPEMNGVVLSEEKPPEEEDSKLHDSYKVLYTVLSEKDGEEATKEDEEEKDEKDENKRKIKKEPGGKLYSCDECQRTFNHPSSLMYHKESVHNDGRRFVCSKCGKSFTHKQLLQRHQMVHSDTR